MPYSGTTSNRSQLPNSRPNRDNHLAQHSSRILLTGALLLVGASAALGSYFGYIIGSQTHALLGLVFAGAALGGEIVKPYACQRSRQRTVAFQHRPSARVRKSGWLSSCSIWVAGSPISARH
jgi:hypothetical protein